MTGVLRSCGNRALTDDAAIITAELAASAVLHARSGFTVTLSRAAAAVRISVRDTRPCLLLAAAHRWSCVPVMAWPWRPGERPNRCPAGNSVGRTPGITPARATTIP